MQSFLLKQDINFKFDAVVLLDIEFVALLSLVYSLFRIYGDIGKCCALLAL